MNRRALPEATRAALLDVEGTVGDARFVAEVLFPYARSRLGSFVAREGASPAVRPILEEVARLALVSGGDTGAIVRTLEAWSDANAKVGSLKALQGLIWRDGYREGELRAHVYGDVPAALEAWARRGIAVAIYSSGSVLAQKLYFAHSTAGDLTRFLAGYFDTSAGPKASPASYARIALALGHPAAAVSFFSDAAAEVEAAREAGMHAVRVDRARSTGDAGRDPAGNEWWGGIDER